MTPRTATTFRTLFSYKDVRFILTGAALWQMAFNLVLIPLLVVVHDTTNSWAVAGTTLAVGSLLNAFVTPLQGKLMDQYGIKRIMNSFGLCSVIGFMMAASFHDLQALVILGATAGIALRPNPPMLLRLMWKRIIPDPHDQQIGHAFVGIQTPVMHALGPLLASGFMTVSSSNAAVGVGAIVGLCSYLVYTQATTASEPPPQQAATDQTDTQRERLWSQSGILIFLAAYALLYATNATVGLVIVARTDAAGSVNLAGVLTATSSISGAVCATLLTSRARSLRIPELFLYSCVAILITLILMSIFGHLLLFGVALALFGASWAAVNLAISVVLSATPVKTRQAELLGWAASMTALGEAAGRFMSGALIDLHATNIALIVAAVFSGIAAFSFKHTKRWISQRDILLQRHH